MNMFANTFSQVERECMPTVARLHKLSIKLGKFPSCAGLNLSLDGLDLFQFGNNELVRSPWRLVTAVL